MEDFEAVLDVILNKAVTTTPSTRYSNAIIIAESLREAVRKDKCFPPVYKHCFAYRRMRKKAKSVTPGGIQRQKASVFSKRLL